MSSFKRDKKEEEDGKWSLLAYKINTLAYTGTRVEKSAIGFCILFI